jgi:Cu-processing system permease protein
MKATLNIFKFVFIDNLKSIWAITYMLFFALSSFGLIYFTGSFSRSVVSLMNIVILIVPLVSTMMTTMYYYNKTDFLHLLLSQPVKRSHAFLGIYLGIAVTHSLAVLVGLLLGIVFNLDQSESISVLISLIICGVALSLVFSSIAFFLSVAISDKLRGIGLALIIWLLMAVVYDGLMLLYFVVFAEYPIEEHAIVLSMLNPIDMGRIFIMLKLDVAALMGYSGAVFSKFFGSTTGMLVSAATMISWIVLPLLAMIWKGNRRDF